MSHQIKVMSYNLHSGIGTDKQPDWARIAQVIRRLKPDVVGLQEAAIGHARTPELNLPEALGKDLNMHMIFGEAIKINQGQGQYGLALLSRYPMKLVDKVFMPIPTGRERRIFLIAHVAAPKPFYLIVTHFPYEGEMVNDAAVRRQCAELLTATIKKNNYQPAILTGDFNSFRDSEVMAILRKDWDIWNDGQAETQTCCVPIVAGRMIDYIGSWPRGAFQLKKFTFDQDFVASDHCPITAELIFNHPNN